VRASAALGACSTSAHPSGLHVDGEQRFGRVVLIELAGLEQAPDRRSRGIDGGSRRCLLSFGVVAV
jgi:hypothetical protein